MAVALLCVNLAQAQLTIEITRGSDKATPIAVVPFNWQGAGGLPENVSDIVTSDLKNSGLFETISESSMLDFPARSADVSYRDWRAIGADFMVVGQVRQAPEGYQAVFELLDVTVKQYY